MKKTKWKKSEKRMLFFSLAVCLSFIGLNALYQWNNRVPDLQIPQAAPPSPNAFDSFRDAAAAYVPPKNFGAGLDSHIDTTLEHHIDLFSAEYSRRYPLRNKLAFLKLNAKSLETFRQGFKYSYLQPPERDAKEHAPYARYRDLARLLLLEAHARAQAGNWNGAADSLLDCLHLGYEIPRGGALISGLVGLAIRLMAINDFKNILPRISAHKARDAARQIEDWQSTQVTTAQSLEEEKRAQQGTILGLIRSRDLRPLYVTYPCIYGTCNVTEAEYEQALNELEPLLKMRLAWMNKPRLLDEYSRCIDWQIAQAQKPFPLRDQSWPFSQSHDGLEEMINPQFTKSPTIFGRCHAKSALLLTTLALRAFRLEHHCYPNQLSQLVPKYLSRVPLDPFSNRQTLRYRLQPERYIARDWWHQKSSPIRNRYESIPFTLYSIGPNARDDGGTPYLSNHDEDGKRYIVDLGLPDTAKADIVAGIN